MGLRIKNFNIIKVHSKNRILGMGGGVTKSQHIGGNCLKRGRAWTVHRFKRGTGEKQGALFEVIDTPMHAMVQENTGRVTKKEYCYNNESLV